MTVSREADLGPPVIAHLEEAGWDVYQEVPFKGSIADVVGVLGKRICIVELKRGLGFDVLAQAMNWRGVAHWIWVGVPAEKVGSAGRHLAVRIAADLGTGVLEVRGAGSSLSVVTRAAPAPLHRRADPSRLLAALRPEHKTSRKAGSTYGRVWTPFNDTCKALREYLANAGGEAPLIEAMRGMNHHYASPASGRAHLSHWIEVGKVEGVALVSGSRPLLVRLAPPPSTTSTVVGAAR